MDPIQEMAFVLASSGDTHAVATGVLDHLIRTTGSKSGAVFSLSGALVVVFVERNMGLTNAATVGATVMRERDALSSGRSVVQPKTLLLPIVLGDGGQLLGVLFLEEPRHQINEPTRAWSATALATALHMSSTPTKSAAQAAVRERIVAKLEETQWNLARAAREMGITRRTLYLRIERFGITRLKIPKITKSFAL